MKQQHVTTLFATGGITTVEQLAAAVSSRITQLIEDQHCLVSTTSLDINGVTQAVIIVTEYEKLDPNFYTIDKVVIPTHTMAMISDLSLTQNKVLSYLLINYKPDAPITLVTAVRDEIALMLKISKSSVTSAFKSLSNDRLLVNKSEDVYAINPELFQAILLPK